MKTIIYFISSIFLVYLLTSCGKSNDEPDSSSPEMYVSIDGDLRQINDVGLKDIRITQEQYVNGQTQVQEMRRFKLVINDPEKKVIGDIGSFVNTSLVINVSTYPDPSNTQNKVSFKCFEEHDDCGNLSGTAYTECCKGKANVILGVGSSYHGHAEKNQIVTVEKTKEGKYIILLKDVLVPVYRIESVDGPINVRLSARYIY
jgi:hypothetical protein